MRTAALDSAPQVALRDCSKEAGEKVSIHLILAKEEIHIIKHMYRRFLLVS